MNLLIIIILAIILAPVVIFIFCSLLGVFFIITGRAFKVALSGLEGLVNIKKPSQSDMIAIKMNVLIWGGLILFFIAEFTFFRLVSKV